MEWAAAAEEALENAHFELDVVSRDAVGAHSVNAAGCPVVGSRV